MINLSKITRSFLFGLLFVATVSYSQDRVIPASELPSQIKKYISSHFINDAIVKAEEDDELMSKTYEIELKSGVELEFNSKKEVIEIKGDTKLPDSVIPKRILQYVKANYPNNVIVKWELDGRKQQIELDNDVDLEFNRKGKFLRIDD